MIPSTVFRDAISSSVDFGLCNSSKELSKLSIDSFSVTVFILKDINLKFHIIFIYYLNFPRGISVGRIIYFVSLLIWYYNMVELFKLKI